MTLKDSEKEFLAQIWGRVFGKRPEDIQEDRHFEMQPKNSKPGIPYKYGWPEKTFYESLILAQDERWRRA
ncbi:MAG: hypothetical protein HFH43_14420 [Lachnospiraceae bacterium]|nr:hypothetical protein [Lachnospiraceae bacterium]